MFRRINRVEAYRNSIGGYQARPVPAGFSLLRFGLLGCVHGVLRGVAAPFPEGDTLRAVGVRFWGGVFDSGQTVARGRVFGRRLSSVAQSRKPKKLKGETTKCREEPDWHLVFRKTAIGVLTIRAKEARVLKRILAILPAVCLATSMASPAQSPFIGQWNFDSTKSRTPDEMKVQSQGGNKYTFDFGGGAETIVADGTDQPGLQGTLLSAKQEAPDTWIVERKKDGRLMLRATWKLSADGSTLTDYYREFESDGSTLSLDYVYQRTGGGSGFAADWQSIKETRNTPLSMEVKAYEGDGLSFLTPAQHRPENVKFDGKDYPEDGSDAGQGPAISARQVDEHNLVITHKYNGKVTGTEEVGLSADLKTLTITLHFAGRDKPDVMVYQRQ
jgi:hypothetical protein